MCLMMEERLYRERYLKSVEGKGSGWYSFNKNGVHFIGLVNVLDLQAGGLGQLGDEQLEWLEDDVKGLGADTPIVVFAHIPLWRSIRNGAGEPAIANAPWDI